jgi:hypothetical protein
MSQPMIFKIKEPIECEHCGHIKKGFAFYDGNTYWCLYCALADDHIDEAVLKKLEKAK